MTTQNRLVDLTPLGLLSIAGENTKKFLQGQVTCNLDDITETKSCMGAHCNPQGRIISFFRLFLHNGNYYLQMPHELIPIAMQALQKYAVFFKLALADVSTEFKQLGFIGELQPEQYSADNIAVISLSGELTRYVFMGKSDRIKTLENQLLSQAILADYREWKALDVQSHIPAIYPDTSEKFLPHDLDLPKLGAVSFNKGCYTGQEIIARMQYRGKLKNHLHRATVSTTLALTRGNDIYADGKSCGTLVDYYQMDQTTYELLIVAQDYDIENHTLYIDLEHKYSLAFNMSISE